MVSGHTKPSGEQEFTAKELLLGDLKIFSEAFWKNEELGERRLSFFLGLVTAVLGGLAAFAVSRVDVRIATAEVRIVAQLALLVLLPLGLVTFFRMVRRNWVSDDYKEAMDYIRCYFTKKSPSLDKYELLLNEEKSAWIAGGLTDLVAVVNGILLGSFLYLLIFSPIGTWANKAEVIADCTVAIIIVLAFVTLQIVYARRVRQSYRDGLKMKYKKSLQAIRPDPSIESG